MTIFTKKEQRVFIAFCSTLFIISLGIFLKQRIFIEYTNQNVAILNKINKSSLEKLNINTATIEEFQKLPYIGSVISQRIIEYRLQNGNFKKIEEIMNIKGIGKKKFDKIKNLIMIKKII